MRVRGGRKGFGYGALVGLIVMVVVTGEQNAGMIGYLLTPTVVPCIFLLPNPAHYKTVWVDIIDMAILFLTHTLLYAYIGTWIFGFVSKRFGNVSGLGKRKTLPQ